MIKKMFLSLGVCLTLSSQLFATISNVDEVKVLKGLKNELQVPARIDKVSSIVDIYIEKEKNKNGGKNIVLMYIIDGESTFDKNVLKNAYDKDFINMTCNSELKKLFGDDSLNTVKYRVMFNGETSFLLSYDKKMCK